MKTVIVDERISEDCETALVWLGFNILKLPSCPRLPEAIRSHPDSLLFKKGNRIFTYSSYAERGLELFSDIREFHRDISLTFVAEEPGEQYPFDAQLNALAMGDRLFARRESISRAVLEYAQRIGMKIIGTRQGYPACTTLALDEGHAVTSDRGMARIMEREGIEVLLMGNGGISLPPYEYGFIGGSSFVYKNTVYFFGNIERHSDGERIVNFATGVGFKVVSLSKEGLCDLGGAVVLE